MERQEFLLQEKGLELIELFAQIDAIAVLHKDQRKVAEIHEEGFYFYDQNTMIDAEMIELINLIQGK